MLADISSIVFELVRIPSELAPQSSESHTSARRWRRDARRPCETAACGRAVRQKKGAQKGAWLRPAFEKEAWLALRRTLPCASAVRRLRGGLGRARAPFPCADYEEGAGAPEDAEDTNRETFGSWSVRMACVYQVHARKSAANNTCAG